MQTGNSDFYQELFTKCGFQLDHVCSNDNTMTLTEDEKYDWQSLQPLGVEFAVSVL
jgi:hypothetical protein